MPIGPRGERRPADVVGRAVHVMRIATGEIEEELDERRSAIPGAALEPEKGAPKARRKRR